MQKISKSVDNSFLDMERINIVVILSKWIFLSSILFLPILLIQLILLNKIQNPFIISLLKSILTIVIIFSSLFPQNGSLEVKRLDNFRNFMYQRKDIKLIKHFDDPSVIFGKTIDLKDDVNYFLKDSNHSGDVEFNDKEREFSQQLIMKAYRIMMKLALYLKNYLHFFLHQIYFFIIHQMKIVIIVGYL